MNPIQEESRSPAIGSEQIELLERLCNADGVSGGEGPVRNIVLEEVTPHAAEVKRDALGNVLVTCPGTADGPRLRVMLAAHMDEVGLMLTDDEGEGIFRFEAIGGLDPRQLAGKAVRVGRDRLPGVIGARPIHFSSLEEIKHSISMDALRVDVGPANAGSVHTGDRVAFATPFSQAGPSLRAKALDNRLGVATLIELVKHAPPNIDLLAAFTVQEEVGLRGAGVAAYSLKPDLAIAVDCTPANDLPVLDDADGPQAENTRYNTRLGHGPAVYLADRSTLFDPRLVRHFSETAEARSIPFQFRQPGGGGTDSGAIHRQLSGIPALSVSTPARYLHTAASLARLADWEHTLALIFHALARLTPELLAGER